jgi:glycerol-3-phosphate acyltransferase PlsY
MLGAFYLALTYLVASIPTGVVLGTLFADVDVTRHGSGNIGATNVTRVLGRGFGAATLAGDVLKGFVPVALAPLVYESHAMIGIVAMVAFAGHCWSAYLDFRGGKGVATAAGGMLAVAPFSTLLAAIVWMLVFMVWRKASLGALVAAGALPVLVAFFRPDALWVTVALGAGVGWRHKENVRRLLAGTERS